MSFGGNFINILIGSPDWHLCVSVMNKKNLETNYYLIIVNLEKDEDFKRCYP